MESLGGACSGDGIERFIEIGPRPVLASLVRRIAPRATVEVLTSRCALIWAHRLHWSPGRSRGIGAAIASALASCGAHVVVGYRENSGKAREVVQAITASGGSAEELAFDVADAAKVKQAVQDVLERHGRIDILVNNAAVSRDSLLLRIKPEDMDQMIGTNLKGAVLCSFHAARLC